MAILPAVLGGRIILPDVRWGRTANSPPYTAQTPNGVHRRLTLQRAVSAHRWTKRDAPFERMRTRKRDNGCVRARDTLASRCARKCETDLRLR